jgi:branched-chain amino acid transport system substrate-binding protein
MIRSSPVRAPSLVAVALLGLVAAGCGAEGREECAAIEYRGPGAPTLVLVSDMPVHGAASRKASQVNEAIRLEVESRGFRAGPHAVAFQACDHSSPETGRWEAARCSGNANAYAERDEVIGVVGPLDSGCAAVMIPVLNNARNDGIPLVSPSNTYPCLTEGGPGCDITEPDKYYPTGERTYFRVVGTDTHQSAALAELAKSLGARRVYVLDDGEAYGRGIATGVRRAARALGLTVVGFRAWDPEASGYRALFDRVRARRPDAVVLAGLLEQNGARVIADKVAVLGANDGPVKLLASDGFGAPWLVSRAGTAAEGMFVTETGVPVERFPATGTEFARRLGDASPATRPVDPYALFGAQAARVLLDAIAASDGTRSDVLARLFETRVEDGLIGSFTFDRNGDPADASGPVIGVTVRRVAGRPVFDATIEPSPAAVAAAAG